MFNWAEYTTGWGVALIIIFGTLFIFFGLPSIVPCLVEWAGKLQQEGRTRLLNKLTKLSRR